MKELTGKYTTATITIDTAEQTAVNQVESLCDHPTCVNKIVCMPDVHAGMSSPIGFTMKAGDGVIPNIVGVDIGCGMSAVNYDVNALTMMTNDIDKKFLDDNIRQLIPMGFSINKTSSDEFTDGGFFDDLISNLMDFYISYVGEYGEENARGLQLIETITQFRSYLKKFGNVDNRVINSIPSLGGGNHYIELGEGRNGNLWVTVHTGSRNLGKQVCDYHQGVAWLTCESDRKSLRSNYITELTDMVKRGDMLRSGVDSCIKVYDNTDDLREITKKTAFLTGVLLYDYLYDMVIAQTYAVWNRKLIQNRIATLIPFDRIETVESIHNYIDLSDFMIRKGAISSYVDEKMIIPLNPKDGSLLCVGKSNPQWNFSAPHGAGRTMSRTQAKREITPLEATTLMNGVFASVKPLDESPSCYKDPEFIEDAIKPTVTIIDRIIPIINFKSE